MQISSKSVFEWRTLYLGRRLVITLSHKRIPHVLVYHITASCLGLSLASSYLLFLGFKDHNPDNNNVYCIADAGVVVQRRHL